MNLLLDILKRRSIIIPHILLKKFASIVNLKICRCVVSMKIV